MLLSLVVIVWREIYSNACLADHDLEVKDYNNVLTIIFVAFIFQLSRRKKSLIIHFQVPVHVRMKNCGNNCIRQTWERIGMLHPAQSRWTWCRRSSHLVSVYHPTFHKAVEQGLKMGPWWVKSKVSRCWAGQAKVCPEANSVTITKLGLLRIGQNALASPFFVNLQGREHQICTAGG